MYDNNNENSIKDNSNNTNSNSNSNSNKLEACARPQAEDFSKKVLKAGRMYMI